MTLTAAQRTEIEQAFAADLEGRLEQLRTTLADATRASTAQRHASLLLEASTVYERAAPAGLAAIAAAAAALERAADLAATSADAAGRVALDLLDASARFSAGWRARAGDAGAEGGKPLVLHIEDSVANRMLVTAILTYRPDVGLLEATTGEEGLRLAAQADVALVLLDLHLPDMSGETVLQRLRSDPATHGLRVVMISAEARPAERDRLLVGGANDYLTKPYDIHTFLAVIDDATVRRTAPATTR